MQRVPSSTIAHVSVSPPLIPDGRISRVRLAAAAFPEGPSHSSRGLSTRLHTPLGCMVIPPARHQLRLLQSGTESRRCPYLVPATYREPLCPSKALSSPGQRLALPRPALPGLHRSYKLMRQSKFLMQISVSFIPHVSAGCCVPPAGRWTFPALFRESFPRCLDPYPGDSHWCTYPFLPRGQRPSPRREWLGTQHYVRTATSVREIFRGYSHLLMFRPPGLLATQVAPTVVCQLPPTHQAAVAFTFTHISVCYLSEQ